MSQSQRRSYTREQKAEAVRLVKVSGQSIAQVARDLGIPENTLWNWINRERIDAGKGSGSQAASEVQAELAKLKRENQQLKEERDFLKKAAAFFARPDDGDLK